MAERSEPSTSVSAIHAPNCLPLPSDGDENNPAAIFVEAQPVVTKGQPPIFGDLNVHIGTLILERSIGTAENNLKVWNRLIAHQATQSFST